MLIKKKQYKYALTLRKKFNSISNLKKCNLKQHIVVIHQLQTVIIIPITITTIMVQLEAEEQVVAEEGALCIYIFEINLKNFIKIYTI